MRGAVLSAGDGRSSGAVPGFTAGSSGCMTRMASQAMSEDNQHAVFRRSRLLASTEPVYNLTPDDKEGLPGWGDDPVIRETGFYHRNLPLACSSGRA